MGDSSLLSAALGGLLCLAACSNAADPTSDSGPNPNPNPTSPDAPLMPDGGAAFQCSGDAVPDAGITSSTNVSLTQADFESQCSAQNGIFEIQPHCGGSNACRGMSYDSETETLTVHTCRGLNACGGFSCIICD